MLWDALKAGFDDELMKIAETSMAGLSSETLLNYPQPRSMPSEAYAKAQAILKKAEQYNLPSEKTANADSPRPDMLPSLRRVVRRRRDDPPPTKGETALSYGANTLGGAGAAKFLGDWVEKGREAAGKSGLSTKAKFTIMTTGGALGLANKARKEHRRKKWQAGHHV